MNEIKLLQALENNARIDLKDLCDELNQNEYKVNEELVRLEEANIICGYHTVINWDKTNKENVTALIEVGATPKRDSGYDDIAKKIYRYPEVSTMYLMSGKMEFIVVINGKSMREVADFVARKLAPIEGVNKTETYFVLKQYKVEGVVLDEEEREFKRQIVSL
jgi:DNA-binding Lrp family transcriptional regulator